MFQTVWKAYLIGPNGTQIVDRELYYGASKDHAFEAFNDAKSRLDATWHFFSPRDRVVISTTGDGNVMKSLTYGEH